MIPLWEPNPSHKTPWVTWSILLACTVAFAFHRTRDPFTQREWLESMAFVPALLDSGAETFGPWARAVSSLWLHTSIAHLAVNMLYLWVFGDRVEAALGPARFIALYLSAGFVGAIAQWATTPAANVPMVGASAAIAGVLAARLVFYPKEPIAVLNLVKVDRLPAYMPILGWFIVQAVATYTAFRNVAIGRTAANAAHLGGFFAGLALAWALRKSVRDE
jgi:membrane associated rhomboid family serine protease